MDHGDHQIIREYAGIRKVVVNCKSCDKTVGEFDDFKKSNSRANWTAKLDNMDWEIKFKIQNKKISCDCGNALGKMTTENDVLFTRKSLRLKY